MMSKVKQMNYAVGEFLKKKGISEIAAMSQCDKWLDAEDESNLIEVLTAVATLTNVVVDPDLLMERFSEELLKHKSKEEVGDIIFSFREALSSSIIV